MVFATDFDPIDPSPRRKSNQSHSANSTVNLSPLHQTNRLIAQATQSQFGQAAQPVVQTTTARPVVARKVEPGGDDIAIAARGLSVPVRDPNALAPLPLPVKPSLPLGLQILNRVQHGSTALASVLIAGALVLYGSSVYVDKSANRAMAHLNHLQGESQQLTSTNEAIKQSLAEQATKEDSGLEPYESDDVLFVAPEPVRAAVEQAESAPERLKPLGY